MEHEIVREKFYGGRIQRIRYRLVSCKQCGKEFYKILSEITLGRWNGNCTKCAKRRYVATCNKLEAGR